MLSDKGSAIINIIGLCKYVPGSLITILNDITKKNLKNEIYEVKQIQPKKEYNMHRTKEKQKHSIYK